MTYVIAAINFEKSKPIWGYQLEKVFFCLTGKRSVEQCLHICLMEFEAFSLCKNKQVVKLNLKFEIALHALKIEVS